MDRFIQALSLHRVKRNIILLSLNQYKKLEVERLCNNLNPLWLAYLLFTMCNVVILPLPYLYLSSDR